MFSTDYTSRKKFKKKKKKKKKKKNRKQTNRYDTPTGESTFTFFASLA